MKKKLFVVFTFVLLLSALFFAETALAADLTLDSGTGTGYIDLSSAAFTTGDRVLINTSETVELRNGGGKALSIVCIVDDCNLIIRDVFIMSPGAGIDFSLSGLDTLTIEGNNTIYSNGDFPGIRVARDNELHINGSGVLRVYGDDMSPGIGNDCQDVDNSGLIVIDGGTVYSYGGNFAAGIGSAYQKGVGNVKINGGAVYAYGGQNAAGLGGGEEGTGNVEITGGTVHAYGGNEGAGIGGGKYGESDVLISGGTVYGYGGIEAAGIGGGFCGQGHVEITGGTVKGFGGDDGTHDTYGGAGIGGGRSGLDINELEVSGDGYVTISGGSVYAEGANGAAGIGGGGFGGWNISGTGVYKGGTGYITINEVNGVCDVEAVGGDGGAGIGGGSCAIATINMNLTTSEITAYGGFDGAGIGSGSLSDLSSCYINIEGGQIEAYGGECGAGIGGGFVGGAIIHITDSNVIAVGGDGAAGIGAAIPWGMKESYIIISGGDIYAEGGRGYLFEGFDEADGGAGIGGGFSNVQISNATVEAIGGAGGGLGFDEMIYGGPGIGSNMDYYGNVTILDTSDITATGGDSAAGIGGAEGSTCQIRIQDSEIVATGGYNGAGIGSGENGNCEVIIDGGTVSATGGENGAGIGTGNAGATGSIFIDGGTISATPGKDAAAIGGGYASECLIVIYDGNIETFTVAGSEAGIGSGYNSDNLFDIQINGGVITARGGRETGQSAAAIGGGAGSAVNTINIRGGEIYAIGGDDDACDDIGAGQSGTCGTVTIEGTAAVFMFNDRVCEDSGTLSLPVPHLYKDSETVASNQAWGYTNFPDEWNTFTAFAYLPPIHVYFDHKWGTPAIVDTVIKYEGEAIDEPVPDPARAGYVFNGWHIDFGCTTPFDFATIKATDGLTIYADWVADGTFKGNLTGSLTDSEGVPVDGAYITLQSRPVTVTTNTAGEFAYGNVYYINHTLIVNDNIGTELKRYAVTFASGASAGSTVDEVAGTINIVYTAAVTGVNIPIAIDASGTTTTVSGPITFTFAGTDPATGRAINPRTGDDGTGIMIYIISAAILAAAGAAYVWRKRKLSMQQ
ncbi:MAG: InlB B-repeat-containing protein [Clostridia bacterium]|nr:InlB B-repeat-containing protein [Clostridia bacterium]